MRLSRAPTHTVHGRRSTEPPPSPPSRPWCIPPCSHIVTLSGFSSSAAGKEAPPARPRSSPPRHTPRPHPTRVTRQILKHATVRELVMVDLDPVLVKLSEANLPYWEGVREDPRYQDPTPDPHQTWPEVPTAPYEPQVPARRRGRDGVDAGAPGGGRGPV